MMKKIGIVAHDAGAANHIVSWIKAGLIDDKDILLSLSGPASAIYEKKIGEYDNYTLEELVVNSHALISGTGWASDIEHEARKKALENKLHVIAVIDHWTNYLERFVRNDETVLPDEIWVSDDYAFDFSKNIFSNTLVKLMPNEYLKSQVNEIEEISFCSEKSGVLFLMEPMREKWNDSVLPGELQALDYFLNNAERLNLSEGFSLKVRPHPSDPVGRYDSYAKEKGFEVDQNSSLAEAIAEANLVVGCQTYAMVVALFSGKKVVSALPDDAPKCILPFKEIVHLRDIV